MDWPAEDIERLEEEQLGLFLGSVSTVFPSWQSDFESFLEESELDREGSEVTVVIPTLNEENNIDNAIHRLRCKGFRNVLIIDGNSSDRTVEIAKDLGVNVAFQKGKGKGVAMRQAFAFPGISEYVVMMDADGSMDPKEIPPSSQTVKGRSGYCEGVAFFERRVF
jgi:cellulose synthase/poly-beta-1,6-N-acetylglucosamine synthase-like glycosyltransferase